MPGNLLLGGSVLVGMSYDPPTAGTYSDTFYKQYLELWTFKLEPYVRYSLVAIVRRGTTTEGRSQGIMRCKEIEREWRVKYIPRDEAGYGYNFLYLGLPFKPFSVGGGGPDDASNNDYWPEGQGQFRGQAPKISSVKSPSRTICLVENAHVWAFPPYQAVPAYPNKGADWTSGNQFIRPRHSSHRKSNVMWADGHASAAESRYLVARGVFFGDYDPDPNVPMAEQAHYIGVADTNELWDLQ